MSISIYSGGYRKKEMRWCFREAWCSRRHHTPVWSWRRESFCITFSSFEESGQWMFWYCNNNSRYTCPKNNHSPHSFNALLQESQNFETEMYNASCILSTLPHCEVCIHALFSNQWQTLSCSTDEHGSNSTIGNTLNKAKKVVALSWKAESIPAFLRTARQDRKRPLMSRNVWEKYQSDWHLSTTSRGLSRSTPTCCVVMT